MNIKIYDPIERNAFNLIQGSIGFKGVWNIKDGKVLGMEIHPCGDAINQIINLKYLQAIELTNGFPKISDNFDETMELARDKSRIAKNVMREGIVIRIVNEMVDEVFGRVSFKIVDPKQLLKHNKK